MDQATSEHQGVLRDQPECSILADMDCHLRLLLLAIARKMFHIDQELYILSSVVGKVLFERKPLGELFIKPKRPMNDSDSDQLNLWGNFFGQ